MISALATSLSQEEIAIVNYCYCFFLLFLLIIIIQYCFFNDGYRAPSVFLGEFKFFLGFATLFRKRVTQIFRVHPLVFDHSLQDLSNATKMVELNPQCDVRPGKLISAMFLTKARSFKVLVSCYPPVIKCEMENPPFICNFSTKTSI